MRSTIYGSLVTPSSTMQAIQFTSGQKKLQLVKTEIPRISDPHDVLIKVAYSGICGTDLHILQGHYPCEGDCAFIMGHEFCGVVEAVGAKVISLNKGDTVAVDPNRGCGVCHHCHSANLHYCVTGGTIPGMNFTLGIFKNGGWAEYALVPDVQVHKVMDGISLEQAALAEPLSCVAHGWDRISPIFVGQKILIIGAGIVGNLWAVVLHLQGHRDVTISEPNPARRLLAKKTSTGFSILSPDELKQNSTDPSYLFDLAIDCSGFAPAIEHAISLLVSGGKLCIFGVAPPHHTISLAPYQIYKKELTIVGVNINPFSFRKSLGFLKSLGDRYLSYENLGIKTFPLAEYNEAFRMLKEGCIAKAVFKF